MRFAAILLLLTLAATLEASGDALMRNALHVSGITRWVWLIAGTTVLAAYGILVNLGPWDFGRVLGIYVVLFFLAAQAINWLGYGVRPDGAIITGGTFICAGGVILAIGR